MILLTKMILRRGMATAQQSQQIPQAVRRGSPVNVTLEKANETFRNSYRRVNSKYAKLIAPFAFEIVQPTPRVVYLPFYTYTSAAQFDHRVDYQITKFKRWRFRKEEKTVRNKADHESLSGFYHVGGGMRFISLREKIDAKYQNLGDHHDFLPFDMSADDTRRNCIEPYFEGKSFYSAFG